MPMIETHMAEWTVEFSADWDVLGPFPISAREQHALSPSFPLQLTTPYVHEPNRSWPSSLADGGQVTWRNFTPSDNRSLVIQHPHIRWDSLRATEGWAVLQHHNILHTTISFIPPSSVSSQKSPLLSYILRQASFFALIPVRASNEVTAEERVIEWHPGDIYAFKNSPLALVSLPNISYTQPTRFHLFITGDYEIRLFGDPTATGDIIPTLRIDYDFTVFTPEFGVVLDSNLHVIPDFVEGWAFGFGIGLGVRAVEDNYEIMSVETTSPAFRVSLYHSENHLAMAQTRIIPITMNQATPFFENALRVTVLVRNLHTGRESSYSDMLQIIQKNHWQDNSDITGIKGTYFLKGIPTSYVAIPPFQPNNGDPRPPILALHGAGVDISDDFWLNALPRQNHSWIISPTGLTSWGLDWHGISVDDIWGSLDALTSLLSLKSMWYSWRISKGTRVVVLGHSNGGQGAWHLMERYPDRIIAGIPAAAYIKSQQYVPLTLSRGFHFIDPTLVAVYAAALAPDDNDLFTTNLIGASILAIHGGADENVPTWHSRELAGLVKTWRSDADVTFIEDTNMPHWYPEVFTSQHVQSFLSKHLSSNTPVVEIPKELILTVAIPTESGSLYGFRIQELDIPGRLGRLRVAYGNETLQVFTTNVWTFSLTSGISDNITIDGAGFDLPKGQTSEIWFRREGETWHLLEDKPSIRLIGPLSRILRMKSPIVVVIPEGNAHARSVALRLAHAWLLYFRVDTHIITDDQAILRDISTLGSIIIIGIDNKFGDQVLQSGPGVIQLSPGRIVMHRTVFTDPSIGIAFIHPHPIHSQEVALFLCGISSDGLERVAHKLLPIRTGMPLPEVLVIGKEADTKADGGIQAAGFWTRTWGWSDIMGWINKM